MGTNRKEQGGLLGILRGMVPLEADNTPCFLTSTAQGRGVTHPLGKRVDLGFAFGTKPQTEGRESHEAICWPPGVLLCYFFKNCLNLWA